MTPEEKIISSLFSANIIGDVSSMTIIFLFVLVVDKTFYRDRLDSLEDKRSWHLPLISLICGGVYYIISNPFEYESLEQFRIVFFSGMKTGAATTVTYRIVKKAFINKLKKAAKEINEQKEEE